MWVRCTLKSPLDWFSIDWICLEFLYSPAGLLCREQCCEYLKCGFPEFMAIGLRWKIIKDSIVLINLIVYLDEASTSCNTHIYTNNWKQNLIHLLRKQLQSKLHEVSYRGCNDRYEILIKVILFICQHEIYALLLWQLTNWPICSSKSLFCVFQIRNWLEEYNIIKLLLTCLQWERHAM